MSEFMLCWLGDAPYSCSMEVSTWSTACRTKRKFEILRLISDGAMVGGRVGLAAAGLVVLAGLVGAAPAVVPVYPLFMQCDPRWGGDEMGVNGPGERHVGQSVCVAARAIFTIARTGQPSVVRDVR